MESNGTTALLNPLPSPFALLNRATDMGKMGKAAVTLLSQVDETMYTDFKKNGVKVGPIPKNPSMVNQDEN